MADCVTCMKCRFKECQCDNGCKPKCIDIGKTCDDTCQKVKDLHKDLLEPIAPMFETGMPCDMRELSSKGFSNVFMFVNNFINVLCHTLGLTDILNDRIKANKKNLEALNKANEALCGRINELTRNANKLVTASNSTVSDAIAYNNKLKREYNEQASFVSEYNKGALVKYQQDQQEYTSRISILQANLTKEGYPQAVASQYLQMSPNAVMAKTIRGRKLSSDTKEPTSVNPIPDVTTFTSDELVYTYLKEREEMTVDFANATTILAGKEISSIKMRITLVSTEHPKKAVVIGVPTNPYKQITIHTEGSNEQYSSELIVEVRFFTADGKEVKPTYKETAILNLQPFGAESGQGTYFSVDTGYTVPINGSYVTAQNGRLSNYTRNPLGEGPQSIIWGVFTDTIAFNVGSYKKNVSGFNLNTAPVISSMPVVPYQAKLKELPPEPNYINIHESTGFLNELNCGRCTLAPLRECKTACSVCPPVGREARIAQAKGLDYITVTTFIDTATNKPIAPAVHEKSTFCAPTPDTIWYNSKGYTLIPNKQTTSEFTEGTDSLLGKGMIRTCVNYYSTGGKETN